MIWNHQNILIFALKNKLKETKYEKSDNNRCGTDNKDCRNQV